MTVLRFLVSGPTYFRGDGVNEAGEAFVGELRVQDLKSGRAALLSYVAAIADGTVVHTESTLLGAGPDGKLCLWPVMSEIPVVLRHVELTTRSGAGGAVTTVFGSGQRDDTTSFREEITISVGADRSLVYAHAWGLPGGAFDDRSSCRMMAMATRGN
ncbi:MAG: hypothetical protein V4844_22470 [Pseudomonadota bacterium]